MSRPLNMPQTAEAKKRISESQKARYQMIREQLDTNRYKYFNDVNEQTLTDFERLENKLRRSVVQFTNTLLELASYTPQIKHQDTHKPQLLSDKIDEAIKASLNNVINESKQVRQ